MPKKKKTLKQKMLADARHTNEPLPNSPQQMSTYSVESLTKKEPSVTPKIAVTKATSQTISVSDYSYLSKDLFKTLAVTGGIILVEILLHAFTKGV